MKYLLDKYYEKTQGFYPFFKYCPYKYRDYYIKKRAKDLMISDYCWQSPKTLNEKIRWLIFNEKLELKTKLTDKILVKSYIASKLGKGFSAELYGIYNNVNEIDFSILPDKFALKANHGWRMNILIYNKDFIRKNFNTIKQVSNRWMHTNYELYSIEPQYRNIKPKLFVEHLRESGYRTDIQVFCFNGKAKYIEYLFNKDEKYYSQIYDTNWNLTEFTYMPNICKETQEIPKDLDRIIKFAEILSQEFSFVRVDFAFDENDINVVEMTFTPCSAMIPFHKKEYDLELGNQLILPSEVYAYAG